MADWFYGKDNTQHGPISELEIRNLITTGTITSTTIIWREGMTDWLPLKDVPEFQLTTSTPNQSGGSSAVQANSPASPYASPQTYAAAGGGIPTDGLAIASLVCGILAIVSCYVWGLFGLPAVICGHMSLKKIATSPTPIMGRGMAIAGLVTGYIGITLQLLVIGLFVFAVIAQQV